jgi:hypothetical protein
MTVEFVAFCTGLALLVISIFGGGLEVREVRIANLGPLPRALSALMGIVLLYVYFFVPEKFVAAKLEQRRPEAGRPADARAPENEEATNTPPAPPRPADAPKPAAAASTTTEPAAPGRSPAGDAPTAGGADAGAKAAEDAAASSARLAALEKEMSEAAKAMRLSRDALALAAEDLKRATDEQKRMSVADRAKGAAGKETVSKVAQDRVEAAQKKFETEKVALKQAARTLIDKKIQVDDAIEKVSSGKEEGAPSTTPVVGYVIFAVINKDNSIRKAYFSIDGDGRFPGPDDVITSKSPKIALRSVPFHWDSARRTTVHEEEALAYIGPGQKLRVAGDVFISTDPQNGNQYAVAPIAAAVNFRLDRSSRAVFERDRNDPSVAGYVHLGLIDEQTGDFVEQHFENQTRPNTTIPAPNDRLLAKRDMNIRKGPRYWDASKGEYVNPASVGVIKAGDVVVVGGDTFLARQGQSIWTPIAR